MTRLVTASANAQLDQLLEDACEGLQLTPTQLEEAEDHYTAVGEWLADEQSPLQAFSPKIKPQGSVLQGTVVKPIGRDEFDIDLVCLLDIEPVPLPPKTIYDLVAARLEANAAYKGMLKRDPRCLTLKYAGNFCLDILPALPSNRPVQGWIKIPDRRLNQWIKSNPFGFAEWFKQQTLKRRVDKIAANFAMAESKDVEPLPTDDIAVTPLQRAVQLLKRRRDVVYNGNSDRPSSMLITALAGYHYEGDWPTSDALIAILNSIVAAIEAAPAEILMVPNPSDPSENLTKDWSLDQHRAFAAFVSDFSAKMTVLLTVRGMEQIKRALAELFGENVADDVLLRYGKRLESERQAGNLRVGKAPIIVSGAAATAASHTIPGNTFFGS